MSRAFSQWNPDSRKTNSNQDDSEVLTDPRTLHRGNETLFNPNEGSIRSRRKFRRLHRHNLDVFNRYETQMSVSADRDYRLKMMQALAGQLAVSERVRYRATRKLYEVDGGRTGYPLPVIGFCLYVHFFDEETDEYESCTQSLYWERDPGHERIYWPSSEGTDNDENFQRVADTLREFYSNVSRGGIQRILQKLDNDALPTRVEPSTPMKREIVG